MTDDKTSPSAAQEFQSESQRSRSGFFAELWGFLKHNKKWWLLPILIVIGLVGALAAFSATGAGPFIYTFW